MLDKQKEQNLWAVTQRYITESHKSVCFTYLSSTSRLRNIATALALPPGFLFYLSLASISPAKLTERSTRAAYLHII